MWAPNIADFSKDYHVFALDVMGQPSKSIAMIEVRSPSAPWRSCLASAERRSPWFRPFS